ncbi:hypothetical protein HQO37_17035, partial [Rhodococcus fascians]|nr:hypothetical protein [Rhodococcus fascians]
MKFAPKIAVLAAVVIVPVGVALASTVLADAPQPPSFEPRVTVGVATSSGAPQTSGAARSTTTAPTTTAA